MNFVPMSILEYRFDDAGITQTIIVAFSSYAGNDNINVRVSLTQEYVESQNPNLVLDAMNKEQIETFARRKVRDWILTERPEDYEGPEEPEGTEDPEVVE